VRASVVPVGDLLGDGIIDLVARGHGRVTIQVRLPDDPALAGAVLYTQGFGRGGPGGVTPYDARDLVVGVY
jgi:hypothetical protein